MVGRVCLPAARARHVVEEPRAARATEACAVGVCVLAARAVHGETDWPTPLLPPRTCTGQRGASHLPTSRPFLPRDPHAWAYHHQERRARCHPCTPSVTRS